MYFTKPLVLFFSALSVSALATPHAHRGVHHRALSGRITVPAPAGDVPALPLRSRQNGKRCKPRLSSQSPAPETTKAAPSTHNAQVAPKTTTEAPPPPPTTQKPSPTPKPTTKEQPPPPATTTKKLAAPPPSKPAPPPPSNLPSFLVGTQTGQGTFYASMSSYFSLIVSSS